MSDAAGVPGQLFPVSSVGVPDDSSEAFSGGGEFVFELFGAALGGVGLGGAGVAFGEELAVRSFQCGDPCDEFGPVGLFDLGTELQPQSAPEFVEICSQPVNLVSSDGEVGAQAGGCDGLVAGGCAGGGWAASSTAWRCRVRAASRCSRMPSA